MTEPNKPREWYLNFGTSLGVDVRNPNQFNQAKFPRDKDYQDAAVRVIEYSAYEAIQSANAELTRKLAIAEKICRTCLSDVGNCGQRLDAELNGATDGK